MSGQLDALFKQVGRKKSVDAAKITEQLSAQQAQPAAPVAAAAEAVRSPSPSITSSADRVPPSVSPPSGYKSLGEMIAAKLGE